MEQGKVESPHFEGENEEVAKKLKHSRIEDLIKGISEGITAQEVFKQKGEYNYIDLTEEHMAPCQHAYLYEETIARVLGRVIITNKVT